MLKVNYKIADEHSSSIKQASKIYTDVSLSVVEGSNTEECTIANQISQKITALMQQYQNIVDTDGGNISLVASYLKEKDKKMSNEIS